jgi:hypothetical protein
MNLFYKLFPRFAPSTDKVLSSFQKTIDKLHAVAAHHTDKAIEHHNAVEFHTTAKRQSEIESERAHKVRAKMEEIFA